MTRLPETVTALVLDLDGVVVESRTSYRLAYTYGLDTWLREDLGWEVAPAAGRETLLGIEDAHALKRFPGFNAPIDVVTFLSAFVLARTADGRVGPLDLGPAGFVAGLRDAPDAPAAWLELVLAALPPARRREVEARLDPEAVLRRSREHYAGDSHCERVYGFAPSRPRGEGLWRRDRLLLPPEHPPPPVPLAVFTGRDEGEARWVVERFRVFEALEERHLWHRGRGVDKPDPEAFAACVGALGGGPVLYVGDLVADVALVERYRALGRGPEVVMALVGEEGPREAADLHAPSVAPLLEALPGLPG